MECAICFERLRRAPVLELPCGHSFHERCVDKWGETSMTCPYCRAPFQYDQDEPKRDWFRMAVWIGMLAYFGLFLLTVFDRR